MTMTDKELKLKVLEFWHKVEFFQSTTLSDLKGKSLVIKTGDPDAGNTSLPWIKRDRVQEVDKSFKVTDQFSYKIFFGLFKIQEITHIAKGIFGDNSEEWEERKPETLTPEAITCSATVMIDEFGQLDIDRFVVSTCPWALSLLEKKELDKISYRLFKNDLSDLKTKISKMLTVANSIKEKHKLPSQLSMYEIQYIEQLLCEWSGFKPKDVVGEIRIECFKKGGQWNGVKLHPIPEEAVQRLKDLDAEVLKGPTSQNEKETPGTTDESTISILNSFFIADIEKAISDIEKDRLDINSPLSIYLQHTTERSPDLLSREGQQVIGKALSPGRTPYGHWPEDDFKMMSLMQQFAINTIEKELDEGGLFSVNGPPGTGKTTMLREIVADNLVKRAKVLASLEKPEDAFVGSCVYAVPNKPSKTFKRLKPELCGFEMVVVSSNNQAVENITKELPQLKALGPDYKNGDYFKPVAQKLLALQDEQKMAALDPDQDCWGLLSAALGNSTNRNIFTKRVFTNKPRTIEKAAETYKTLPDFLDQQKDFGNLFRKAKEKYLKSYQAVKDVIDELSEMDQLDQEAEILMKEKEDFDRRCEKFEKSRRARERWIERLDASELFGAIISLKVRQYCRHKRIANALAARVQKEKGRLKAKEEKFKEKSNRFAPRRSRLEQLKENHSTTQFYRQGLNLEDIKLQRRTFGQNQELNRLRAALMLDALSLHKAWIIEAYKGSFKENLGSLIMLLQGKIADPEAAKILWQSLFLVVPVISSAFASVENQFKDFKAGELGWFFIDEAGQASPQQAVGTLWRARRAVVVGDPLQIEPVFTIPPHLVDNIGKEKLGESYKRWTPTLKSVQNLADEVNKYGTCQISDEWLGSPLRVHRRCKFPMFDIANKIAYGNKMFHGEDNYCEDNTSHVWGPSCWIDVRGRTVEKQYVEEQGQAVVSMLKLYMEAHGRLPDLYIISPFRKVKERISLLIGKSSINNKSDDYKKWVKDRVGTVHTFQGKEELDVIFVLGADENSKKSAEWASSSCNLLNVAVTRAKKRVYLIGDYNLWSSLPNFSDAEQLLGYKQLTDIINRSASL